MKIGTRNKAHTTNPGDLSTQITLCSPTSATSGGFQSLSYTPVATVWSDWKNLHGNDVLQSGIPANRMPARVMIRYRSDIDPSWTVLNGSQRYEIIGFDNIRQRSEYIELTVQTFVGG